MPLMEALVDDFTTGTLDPARWVANPAAAVVSAELRLTSSVATPVTFASVAVYAIGGSSLAARVVPLPATGTSAVTELRAGPDPGGSLGFAVDTVLGTLRCEVVDAAGGVVEPVAAIAYGGSVHRWLRVSVADVVTWEASPSGLPGSWVVLRTSDAVPAWVGTENQSARLTVSRTGGTAGGFAVLDDVNAAASVVGGPPLVDDFDGAALDAGLWGASQGTPTQLNGRLILDPGDALESSARVNLTGARQWVDLFTAPTAPGSEAVVAMTTADDGALRYRITVGADSATLSGEVVQPDGTAQVVGTAPFDLAGMRFLQFREAGGRVFFEYGPSLSQVTSLEPGGRVVPFSVTSCDVQAYEKAAVSAGAYAATYEGTY